MRPTRRARGPAKAPTLASTATTLAVLALVLATGALALRFGLVEKLNAAHLFGA